MAKRTYNLKKRAEQQEETRQRIVDATIYLHQTVGGQAATISAIAAEAGVERLTVYRHFPDEHALLSACTSHYMGQNPPPDPATWQGIDDPTRCLRTALTDIYAYHRQTEAIMSSAYADMPRIPLIRELMQPLFDYWSGIADGLADQYPVDDESRMLIRAAVGHAVDFLTWRSLSLGQGLDDNQAVEVMVSMVGCLAG
jgi:AcrR family transcriptional regulator